MDPYKTLNISRDSSDEEIKKAYRKLAAKYHPDRGGDENLFKQINEAYSKINTKEKRQNNDIDQNFGGHRDIFSGFEDLLGGLFGHQNQAHQEPRVQSDDNIIFDLKISLTQIKRGFSQNIVFDRNKVCQTCNGAGGKNKRTCQYCGGVGMQVTYSGNMIHQSTCRACSGVGHSFQERCGPCHGHGFLRTKESINFKIHGN